MSDDRLEPGYIGFTPEGREFVIVDVTPHSYIIEYSDDHSHEEVIA